MSPPRENVLFVPNRNVLLTRSGWGGERSRSSDYDPAGPRPPGGAEEGPQEAHQAIAGSQGTGSVGASGAAPAVRPEGKRRQGRRPRFARATVEAEDAPGGSREDYADLIAGGLPRFRTDSGQRVPGQEAQRDDRPGSTAADHGRGGPVADTETKGGEGTPMAAAAELSRRVGAVGYERSRLAGRAWQGEFVPDPYDRRCHQPVDRPLRETRLDGGEHALVVAVPGASWSAGGILHGQGESVSYGSEDGSRCASIAAGRARALTADADRAPRSGGRCGSWGLCGFQPTHRKPRLTLHTAPPANRGRHSPGIAGVWRVSRPALCAVGWVLDPHTTSRLDRSPDSREAGHDSAR